MNTPTLNPQIVGQAENAHGAIMNVVLAGTGLNRDRWVVLTLTMAAGGATDRVGLVTRVTGALKITEAAAQATIAELTDAGLLTGSDQLTATAAGRAMFARVRGDIGPIIERAYAGIPAEDLQTAARVLMAVTAGLNRELPAA
jgi:DNA-binding MarR family transcriptional regulator